MNRLLRNAGIGAVACSYRALFLRYFDILPIMIVLGALTGCLYTLVEPAVRSRPRLHYLPWVLCAYLIIFGGVGAVALLKHDQESIDMLTNPWFIGFILIVGPIGAYAAARTFEDE